MPDAPQYIRREVIAQTHPTYSATLLQELRDLYVGGYEIASRASTYLPQLVGEASARWTERTQHTAYVPYLGHVVDHFASALFAQRVHVRPAPDEQARVDERFYETFAEDADLASSSFSELCRSALTWALVQRRALVAIDFPDTSEAPAANLLDEERSGASRAYATWVPTEQLIDWEYDSQVRRRVKVADDGMVEFDVGWFKWVVLYRQFSTRKSPAHERNMHTEQWKVWRRDEDTGRIVWELYELTELQLRNNDRDISATVGAEVSTSAFQASTLAGSGQSEIPGSAKLIKSGITSFQRVPIVELLLPDGLWVGNKLGPMVKEHYQRRSIINASENRSLVATAYAKLGPEASAPGEAFVSGAQMDPDRGDGLNEQLAAKGYVVIGKDDELGYLEPKGTYAELAEKRLQSLVDEIYRVSHLMAASVSATQASLNRSGSSKREDWHSTNVVLSALGAIVRDFARRCYEVIGEGRGERVSWQASGLDKFSSDDRSSAVTEAVELAKAPPIESATFRAEYAYALATRLLPHLEPGAAEQMRTEIFAAAAKPVESEGGSPPSGTNDTSRNDSKEDDAEDDDETEA